MDGNPLKSIEIHIEMPYPYIWAERCHTFGLKDARKLWSDTWDRWDILHGGFHQSSRCISKSSKRPYAQNDPKVTRRAFFSQYSGRVSAQILQNHIGGVSQPKRGVFQPIFGACFSPGIRQAFGPWRVQILCLCLWPFRSFCSIYLS